MDEETADKSMVFKLGRFLIVFYLLAAVLLKAFFPTESAVMVAGYGIPAWLMVLLQQVELALAFALALNFYLKTIYSFGLGLFTLFALFSLYRAISGAESCGCFGALMVNPWITFVLDVMAAAILVATWPRTISERKGQLARTLPFYLALAVLLGIQATLPSIPQDLNQESTPGVTVMQDLIILEPEKWIGNQLPIADSLLSNHDLSRLKEGTWTLLFHHHDCSKCLEARPKYVSLSKAQANVLFVEVPPFDSGNPVEINQCLSAHLSSEEEWFMQAPIEVQLADGIVISASLDLPAVASSSDAQVERLK